MKQQRNNSVPKARLRSDFLDYYDHHFDAIADVTFERFSYAGMSRREMFLYLSSLGLCVPPYGTPQEVLDQRDDFTKQYPQLTEVVVYLDEKAHRGEAKIKVPVLQAIKEYPCHLAALHLQATMSGNGLTWRYLQIGTKVFWLQYVSKNDWRSNCGEVEIKILSQEKNGYHPHVNHPLFAIDFVPLEKTLYAVDFNIAPQVKGTGVEKVLSAAEAADEIKKLYSKPTKE